jgi:hypothetical protein
MSLVINNLLRLLTWTSISMLAMGCSIAEDCKDLEFSSLDLADKMRIVTNHGKSIRETKDQSEISSLVRFVSARKNKWCIPWYGSPIGSVRAELYSDNRLLGSISMGRNFIGAGMWRVRSITQPEREELLLIFAVENRYAEPNR